MTDYSSVLCEVGLDAIFAILQEVDLSGFKTPSCSASRAMNDVMIVVSAGSK